METRIEECECDIERLVPDSRLAHCSGRGYGDDS